MAEFNKIIVERCHFINADEERIEETLILSKATASIMRVFNNGPILIKIFDDEFGIEVPLTKFRITSSFYRKNERAEFSQTALLRGDEIIEELPITHSDFEDGRINMFMFSKQQGKMIAFLIVNPKGINEYYYRIVFTQ